MYFSGEARWFFRGEASTVAETWIAAGEHAEDQDERSDQYLVLPGCSTTGIKIREGRFEVKARTGPATAMTWSDRIAGLRETWVKWSCSRLDPQALPLQPEADENWVSVTKRRSLRLFSFESGSLVEVATDGPWLAAGCMVEKSEIQVAGDAWWSFCFEAFGDQALLLEHLDSTVSHVAAEVPELELPPEASMSYPAWLASLLV